jgi:DNA-binding transcriptional regulator YiaG
MPDVFRDEVRAASLKTDDDVLFGYIIKRASERLTETEMISLFSVSRTTLDRWKEGRTTPHRLIKPRVYQILLQRLQSS